MSANKPDAVKERDTEAQRAYLRHSYQALYMGSVPVGDGSQNMEDVFVYGERARQIRTTGACNDPDVT